MLMNTLEETNITCPYCGEFTDVLIDCSSGSQQYYEDCAVCCAPILFSLTVNALGELAQLEVKRDDE